MKLHKTLMFIAAYLNLIGFKFIRASVFLYITRLSIK